MEGEICPNMKLKFPDNCIREIKLIRNLTTSKTIDMKEARH